MSKGSFALLVTTCLVVTGCAENVLNPTVEETDCTRFLEVRSGPETPHTVILVDRSNSTRASTPDGKVVDVSKVLSTVRTEVLEKPHVVSIGSFDGAATSARWSSQRLSTDGLRTNEHNREADQESVASCFDDAVAAAVQAPPEQTGTDVSGALLVGREELSKSSGTKRIVLVTDGLTDTGCVDMTDLRIGQADVLPRVRRSCAARPEALPDLAGVQVSLLGVGHPAQEEPQPRTGHLGWLSDFWLGVCEQTGADVCQVSTAPVDMTDAVGRQQVPEVADFNPVYGPEQGGPPSPQVIRVPDEVLFTPNSTVISDRGQRVLKNVTEGLPAGASVQVHGYTEAQSTPEGNLALATGRAEAVRAVLARHGLRRVVAVGHPGRAPNCPTGQEPGARQCTRRVDIVVGE